MSKLVLILSLAALVSAEDDAKTPLYKYRYETEDVMNTAASTIPLRGYHVVEGGYYPEVGLGGGIGAGGGVGIGGIGGGYGGAIGGYGGGIGYGGGAGLGGAGIGGAGIGGAGIGLGGAGIGLGGAGLGIGAGKYIGGGAGLIGGGAGLIGGGAGLIGGGAGLVGGGGAGLIGGGAGLIGGGAGLIGGGGYGGGGYIGGPLHHGYGGEAINKNIYSNGQKGFNDLAFQKASGQNGGEFNEGKAGYNQGIAAIKSNKGEGGYYNDAAGGKKIVEDGKNYYGGQKFDKAGKQGGQFNEQKGHKKGHVIKGYKSSHHKDETGKTEEFYDEENDQGGKLNFAGQSGSFGEKGASAFKGGLENGEFARGEHKKQSHFDNEHLLDNSNAGQGKYGEKKYGGSGSVYGANKGIDEQSLLGHQESSKFYKHFPHHVPFY